MCSFYCQLLDFCVGFFSLILKNYEFQIRQNWIFQKQKKSIGRLKSVNMNTTHIETHTHTNIQETIYWHNDMRNKLIYSKPHLDESSFSFELISKRLTYLLATTLLRYIVMEFFCFTLFQWVNRTHICCVHIYIYDWCNINKVMLLLSFCQYCNWFVAVHYIFIHKIYRFKTVTKWANQLQLKWKCNTD